GGRWTKAALPAARTRSTSSDRLRIFPVEQEDHVHTAGESGFEPLVVLHCGDDRIVGQELQ
ncbi:MAG: hypothetical protein K2P15_03830, partial [Oscillospiraceae bacterium]|nr:hypothetical protein [Oscillospiraceae bacterium]